jgi:hypothetical protein
LQPTDSTGTLNDRNIWRTKKHFDDTPLSPNLSVTKQHFDFIVTRCVSEGLLLNTQ